MRRIYIINKRNLKVLLDSLVAKIDKSHLFLDPLKLVRRHEDPLDQESAAFIASVLAVGKADLICRAVQQLLDLMGRSPHRFIKDFDPSKNSSVFDDFSYRFYRGKDIGLLIWWMKQVIDKKGSIKEFFLENYDAAVKDIGPSLSRFVRSLLHLESRPFYPKTPPRGSGARHFLTDPADGSGCKRLNLFLRWMVRRGFPDLGLWTEVSPSQLVIPLDTHITRLGRKLGLTGRKSPDWKMALEITESLRELDPADPVKYDFALCTIGKLTKCPDKPGEESCQHCPVASYCLVLAVAR